MDHRQGSDDSEKCDMHHSDGGTGGATGSALGSAPGTLVDPLPLPWHTGLSLEMPDREGKFDRAQNSPTESAEPFQIDMDMGLHEDNSVEQIMWNNSPTQSVRIALTYLLLLLIPGCILTLLAVPGYTLLLATFWFLLFALFGSFVWFIQHDVIHRRALHPIIHAAYDVLVQEYKDFVEDWRHEVLLLTYDERYHDSSLPGNNSNNTMPKNERRHEVRSNVFKVVIKPFLPLMKIRRKKNKREDDSKADAYKPAPNGSSAFV